MGSGSSAGSKDAGGSPGSGTQRRKSSSDKVYIVTNQGRRKSEVKPILNPVRPKLRKHQMFDPDKFRDLDKFAEEEVPLEVLQGDYPTLAAHLTRRASTQLEQVRVLFHWLTSVNLQGLVLLAGSELPPAESALEGLLQIHWSMSNHAHFFARLARSAGLPCEVVTGINKSAQYTVGQALDRDSLAAQWNAVCIDGECYLLDIFWASTCVEDNPLAAASYLWNLFDDEEVKDKQSENSSPAHAAQESRVKHQVNESFFLPDPDQFIYTHFPNDKKWQLLENPISLNQFEQQACLRESFHKLGLSMTNEASNTCVVNTDSGKLHLEFQAPPSLLPSMGFRWKVSRKKQEDEDSSPTASFDRYVFCHRQKDRVTFDLDLPLAGEYLLDIFGHQAGDVHFDKLCSYRVCCEEPNTQAEPLPDLPDMGWGISPQVTSSKLRPLFETQGPYIDTEDGELPLRFSVDPNSMIGFTVRHNSLEDATLRQHAILRRQKDELHISLRLPVKGNYALGIYLEDTAGEKMVNVCNFLVRCQSVGVSGQSFPRLHGGFLGEDTRAKELGVKAESHQDGVIESEDANVQVTFEVSNPEQVELVCELQHNDLEGSKLVDHVQTTREGQLVTFDLALPLAGEYALNVFGKKYGVDYQVFHVHTYLVVAAAGTGAPVKTSKSDITADTIFTADDVADVRVEQSKGALLAVSRKNARNHVVTDQISAKKEGDITVFEVDLPESGEYIAAVFRLKKGLLVLTQIAHMVRLEPLKGDSRPTDIMFPDRRLDKMERRRRKSLALGLHHEAYRVQLKAAVASQNVSLLAWAIDQFELNYVQEKNGELRKSKKILDFMTVSQELSVAMQTRDMMRLEKSLEAADNKGYVSILGLKVDMARQISQKLRKLENIKAEVDKLGRKQIQTEVEGHPEPPAAVHAVLRATCELLGMDTRPLKEWSVLEVLMSQKGRQSLKKQVLHCRLEQVSVLTAMRAKVTLQPYTLQEVKDISSGAAVFYQWSTTVIEEAESRFVQKGGNLRNVRALATASQTSLVGETKKAGTGRRASVLW